MRILLFIWLGFLCLPSTAQTFTTSKQKGVDLKHYKTFRVEKGEIVTGGARKIDQEAFYAEFKSSVVRELKARGYVYVQDSAEVSISYIVEFSTQMETQDFGPLGGVPVDNAALVDQPSHWSREFTQGTLIIDVEDASKKSNVWSATGTMDVTKAKGPKLLDRCVRKAFKKFPKRA